MEYNDEKDVLRYIQRSLSGEANAFEWIVQKYQKRIYYTVFQLVMNHEDADDVVQETFIKAYTKLDTYNEEYPFYPWLYRIAINTSLNQLKKNTRFRSLSLSNIDGNNHNSDLSEAPPQLFEMQGNELVIKLKDALRKIPPEQRVVFNLRVRDELSYQEISETLEISMGTVMSRLSRARDKLRKLLQSYLDNKDVEVKG